MIVLDDVEWGTAKIKFSEDGIFTVDTNQDNRMKITLNNDRIVYATWLTASGNMGGMGRATVDFGGPETYKHKDRDLSDIKAVEIIEDYEMKEEHKDL